MGGLWVALEGVGTSWTWHGDLADTLDYDSFWCPVYQPDNEGPCVDTLTCGDAMGGNDVTCNRLLQFLCEKMSCELWSQKTARYCNRQ